MKCVFRFISVAVCVAVVLVSLSFSSAKAVNTSAKSFIVINADTLEVLEASNAHERLSMASTTKLMTALILAEQNTPDKEIVTTKEMVTVEGSSMGLLEGDSVSYYELLVGMLLPSGNDAANTAAISVAGSVEKFAELMNKRAAEIGMNNTNFVTPSGLDSKEHYSTAYDMALLAAVALKNDVIREIVGKEKITVSFGSPPYQRTLYNHNKLLSRYEYCIGMKTGYTKKSGRCLVSAAEKDGCRVIAVTLSDPNDWQDHESLLEYGLSCLSLTDVTHKLGDSTVDVVGGVSDEVTVATTTYNCACGVDTESGITSKVFVEPFIYAPVEAGQVVGFTEYYYNGTSLHKADIIALQSVDVKVVEPSFFDMLRSKFVLIFTQFI